MDRSSSPLLRVLCVDDNRDSADSLGILLELAGYESYVCYDGPSALAAAETFQPDVCILDLNMPGMEGDEVGRRLRQQLNFRSIPLVAVTAMSDARSLQRTSDAGFDLHLVKPVDPDRLMILLADLVILRGPKYLRPQGNESENPSANSKNFSPANGEKEIPVFKRRYNSHGGEARTKSPGSNQNQGIGD